MRIGPLSPGLRAEYIPVAKGEAEGGGDFDDEFFDLLPGINTSYLITDQVAFFANYQESFRSPQVFGFDVGAMAAEQDLDFEHGQSGEAGLRFEFGGGLAGSVAAWTSSFEDVGVFTDVGYRTIGNIESDGIDYVLHWEGAGASDGLRGFSIDASYTRQNSELVHAIDAAHDGNETPYAWENKLAWSFQYLTDTLWGFSLSGVYLGESFSDEANTVDESADGRLGLNDSRVIWGAQLSKELDVGAKAAARFMVGVTNLFDKEWEVHSRGGFFGGGKVAGAPRQVYFGMNWSF